MSTTGKVLLGVLAGAAVGATIGILYAPDKGSSTRKKIAKGANDKAGEIADKFNGYVDRISKGLEDAKDGAVNFIENGKSKIEDADKKMSGSYK